MLVENKTGESSELVSMFLRTDIGDACFFNYCRTILLKSFLIGYLFSLCLV